MPLKWPILAKHVFFQIILRFVCENSVFPFKYATGENIIGMLPGKLSGSPNDRLFLIGAHYDTMRTTLHGSDDNGSGVAAMLQVAKQLAKGMVCHVIVYLEWCFEFSF